MIDMHAHILPGVDHGSVSLEMSLAHLEAARNAGVDTIVATPHFYLNSASGPQKLVEKRERAVNVLRDAMKASGYEDITLLSGCEVNLRHGLSSFDLKELCIEGTDILLLELPPEKQWGNWIYNEISDILDTQRLKVLLAHIDRYSVNHIEQLFDSFPLYGQLNADSVCAILTRFKAARYLKSGYVWALGSDVHRNSCVYKKLAMCERYIAPYIADIEERSRLLIAPGGGSGDKA